MGYYRLIIVSDESGSMEDVHFLEREDDSPAVDFCFPGQSVDFDEIIEADLPSTFPVNYGLRRT